MSLQHYYRLRSQATNVLSFAFVGRAVEGAGFVAGGTDAVGDAVRVWKRISYARSVISSKKKKNLNFFRKQVTKRL